MSRMYLSSVRRWLSLSVGLSVLVSCGSDNGTGLENGENGGSNGAALNFFEEDLVGLWYRFHSFDGSDNYYRFNADRTACKWEEDDGSSVRLSKSSYEGWSVSETESPSGSGQYRITLPGSGLTSGLTFDFPDNEVWPTGFTNLVYSPSSSGKICE